MLRNVERRPVLYKQVVLHDAWNAAQSSPVLCSFKRLEGRIVSDIFFTARPLELLGPGLTHTTTRQPKYLEVV